MDFTILRKKSHNVYDLIVLRRWRWYGLDLCPFDHTSSGEKFVGDHGELFVKVLDK